MHSSCIIGGIGGGVGLRGDVNVMVTHAHEGQEGLYDEYYRGEYGYSPEEAKGWF